MRIERNDSAAKESVGNASFGFLQWWVSPPGDAVSPVAASDCGVEARFEVSVLFGIRLVLLGTSSKRRGGLSSQPLARVLRHRPIAF